MKCITKGLARFLISFHAGTQKDTSRTLHIPFSLPDPSGTARTISCLPWLIFPEWQSSERCLWANFHAFPAFSAALCHCVARCLHRRVGQHRGPAHARSRFRSDEQAAFADPAQASHMCRQLMREYGGNSLIDHSTASRLELGMPGNPGAAVNC